MLATQNHPLKVRKQEVASFSMTSKETFQDILNGALQKNPKYERMLYEEFVGLSYHLARRYDMSDDDAADIAQETMIIAFEKLKNYDPEKGTFKSWVSKITINEALRFKKKASSKVSLETLSSFEKLLKTEDQHSINEEILPKLQPDQKELYKLYFEYGMNHQEVADNLNISLANSRVKVHRLVKQIKTIFK